VPPVQTRPLHAGTSVPWLAGSGLAGRAARRDARIARAAEAKASADAGTDSGQAEGGPDSSKESCPARPVTINRRGHRTPQGQTGRRQAARIWLTWDYAGSLTPPAQCEAAYLRSRSAGTPSVAHGVTRPRSHRSAGTVQVSASGPPCSTPRERHARPRVIASQSVRLSANSPRPARQSTDGQAILGALPATREPGPDLGFRGAPYGIERRPSPPWIAVQFCSPR
jgi:hypothetical protein